MNVDIFGKCGNFICPRDSVLCDDLLEREYFFYFSFENEICTDYVTEKLYRPLRKFIIPIIYNGANMTRFLPPKSYIDANDFKNAEELSKYLKYLMENPSEYIKYFWWKKHYEVANGAEYAAAYCDLCKMLNNPDFQSTEQYYQDIDIWWEKNQCKMPTIKFKL
jgi:alpha-1,3-fucosyltransferase